MVLNSVNRVRGERRGRRGEGRLGGGERGGRTGGEGGWEITLRESKEEEGRERKGASIY